MMETTCTFIGTLRPTQLLVLPETDPIQVALDALLEKVDLYIEEARKAGFEVPNDVDETADCFGAQSRRARRRSRSTGQRDRRRKSVSEWDAFYTGPRR